MYWRLPPSQRGAFSTNDAQPRIGGSQALCKTVSHEFGWMPIVFSSRTVKSGRLPASPQALISPSRWLRRIAGPRIAKAIARDLVVYYRRPGGQSQFSSMLELEPASSRIKAALSFARAHIAEPLPVERLADAACVSPRQFGRLFVSETGETPARAIETAPRRDRTTSR